MKCRQEPRSQVKIAASMPIAETYEPIHGTSRMIDDPPVDLRIKDVHLRIRMGAAEENTKRGGNLIGGQIYVGKVSQQGQFFSIEDRPQSCSRCSACRKRLEKLASTGMVLPRTPTLPFTPLIHRYAGTQVKCQLPWLAGSFEDDGACGADDGSFWQNAAQASHINVMSTNFFTSPPFQARRTTRIEILKLLSTTSEISVRRKKKLRTYILVWLASDRVGRETGC